MIATYLKAWFTGILKEVGLRAYNELMGVVDIASANKGDVGVLFRKIVIEGKGKSYSKD
jgi:hypothetical protein